MCPIRRLILPAPACDLLDRLTRELEIPLTLTDLQGAVVASTAGVPAGEGDPRAAATAEGDQQVSRYEGGSAPRVYVPVDLGGRRAGTLIAYGEPGAVESPARVAAVAIGLALDFADAASALGQLRISPGWLLYLLLRGSFAEAQQARSMAAILGWELFVQRVALVIELRSDRGAAAGGPGIDPLETLDRVVGGPDAVPYGQIGENEWVVLLHHEPDMPWKRIRSLAETIHRDLSSRGAEVRVGIGEPHLPIQPVSSLRRSYREASYALRLGARLTGGAGVFELRGLGPAAFFAPSGPSRRRLAAHILDPLEAQAGLLETLSAYLALDMSVAATADRLGLHRHTVRNHLERISVLTGLDPRTLDGAVQLKLALLVAAANTDQWDPGPE